MGAIYQFLHEWAMLGLLLCVVILIFFGINRARKSASDIETDDDPWSDGEGCYSEEDTGILPAPVCVEASVEYDDQSELLKKFIKLGEKEQMTVEEEYEYAQLSELLARNYVCVGHPAVD